MQPRELCPQLYTRPVLCRVIRALAALPDKNPLYVHLVAIVTCLLGRWDQTWDVFRSGEISLCMTGTRSAAAAACCSVRLVCSALLAVLACRAHPPDQRTQGLLCPLRIVSRRMPPFLVTRCCVRVDFCDIPLHSTTASIFVIGFCFPNSFPPCHALQLSPNRLCAASDKDDLRETLNMLVAPVRGSTPTLRTDGTLPPNVYACYELLVCAMRCADPRKRKAMALRQELGRGTQLAGPS